MGRSNTVNIIVGARGTGKTQFTKSALKTEMVHFDRLLIVDTFNSEIWQDLRTFDHPEWSQIQIPVLPISMFPRWTGSGFYRMYSSNREMILNMIQEHGRNTVVVFEDSKKLTGSKLPKAVEDFIIDSKQKNIDLFFVYHAMKHVPTDLVILADYLTFFKTNESKVPEKLEFVDDLKESMKYVKDSKNPYINVTLPLKS